MTTIPRISEAMQTVLTTTADNAAHETGFVQRESKMGGASFARTLVFGWLENPQATLEELRQRLRQLVWSSHRKVWTNGSANLQLSVCSRCWKRLSTR